MPDRLLLKIVTLSGETKHVLEFCGEFSNAFDVLYFFKCIVKLSDAILVFERSTATALCN